MARHIVLLRGINVGGNNRIAMAELRTALTAAGFEDVQTLLASGNVVLTSGKGADAVARACESVIEDSFCLNIAVITRSRAQLSAIIKRDPFGDLVTDPRRYQVTFLASKLGSGVADKLAALALEEERLAVHGREVYTWHPDGVGRSKLAAALAARSLGVTATARNWATVGKLLALAAG